MSTNNLEPFIRIIEERYAMFFDNQRQHILQSGINERVLKLKCSSECDYLNHINQKSPEASYELTNLLKLITIGETYFYRNSGHFEVIKYRVLHELSNSADPVYLLSAACSTGEEAYTLAILVDCYYPHMKTNIIAFDVNSTSIQQAQKGIYNSRSVSYLPQHLKDLYFKESDGYWIISDKIKSKVNFYLGNLVEANFKLPPYQYQLIMCRNVFIYFTMERIKKIVSNITQALHPAGYLFLGDAETLRSISNQYTVIEQNNTFFYRRAGITAPSYFENSALTSTPNSHNSQVNKPNLSTSVNEVTSINETSTTNNNNNTAQLNQSSSINLSCVDSEENQQISNPSPQFTKESLDAKAIYQQCINHILHKNFTEAHSQLDSLLEDDPALFEALLLLSIVESNRGENEKAMKYCLEAMSLNNTDSKTHYIHALLLEHNGEKMMAKRALESSLFLDNQNVLAYFKLANSYQSAAKTKEACRCYENAIQCIRCTPESNPEFEVFSGGFSPQMIKGMCESALSSIR